MIRVALLLALVGGIAHAQDAGAPAAEAAQPIQPAPEPPAPPPPESPANPPPRPVFKQAWFWGVLLSSIAVVAAGVAIGITFGR